MKKLLTLVALAVAGLLAWNWYTTGELRLMPSSAPASPEEARLDELEERYSDATRMWAGAQRGTGLAGIDMTADAEVAASEIDQVKNQLERLIPGIKDEKLKARAKSLLRTVVEYERRMS